MNRMQIRTGGMPVRAVSGLCAVVLMVVVFQAPGASQDRFGEEASLLYNKGQAIEPVFHGWVGNPDGTADLYFSYFNRNLQEKFLIPVGPDNNISPAPFGPDGGQPTYFYPRLTRWVFAVRVPKDFGSKEIVWSVTANGKTIRAYGSLAPGYATDDFMIMHENGNSVRGRAKPTLTVEGEKQRTAKVGQPVQLVAVADAPPIPRPGRAVNDIGAMGGEHSRVATRGLRLGWSTYRGPGDKVTFDPPIPFLPWETQAGGSPWSPDWPLPPIPPGNKWIHNVTFHEPGTYVLRAQAHDGYQFVNENITFTVTP